MFYRILGSDLFTPFLHNTEEYSTIVFDVHHRKDAVRVVVQGIMANFSKK